MKINTIESNRDVKHKTTIYDFSDEPNSGEVMYYCHGAENVHKQTKFTYPFSIVSDYEETNFETTVSRNMMMLELMGAKKPKYIICISIAPIHLIKINKPSDDNDGSYLPRYKALMLQLESGLGASPLNGKRLMLSHSQGGWSASVLATQPETRDMFSKVVCVNPLWPLQPWKSGFPGDWAITNATNAIFLSESVLKDEKNYQDAYIASYAWPLLKTMPCKMLALGAYDDKFKFFVKVDEVKQIAKAFKITNYTASFERGDHDHFNPKTVADFLVGP